MKISKKIFLSVKELLDSNQYNKDNEEDLQKMAELSGSNIEEVKNIIDNYDKIVEVVEGQDKENAINLSLHEKATQDITSIYNAGKSGINKLKDFDKELYTRIEKTTNEIKALGQDNKDYSTQELKKMLSGFENQLQDYKKVILDRQDEAIKNKEINKVNVYQTAYDGCDLIKDGLHDLVHSSEAQDVMEKRGDKDARAMLKNATENDIEQQAKKIYHDIRKIEEGRMMNIYVSPTIKFGTSNQSIGFDAWIVKDEKSLYDEILRLRKEYQKQSDIYKHYFNEVLKGFAEIDNLSASEIKKINK